MAKGSNSFPLIRGFLLEIYILNERCVIFLPVFYLSPADWYFIHHNFMVWPNKSSSWFDVIINFFWVYITSALFHSFSSLYWFCQNSSPVLQFCSAWSTLFVKRAELIWATVQRLPTQNLVQLRVLYKSVLSCSLLPLFLLAMWLFSAHQFFQVKECKTDY